MNFCEVATCSTNCESNAVIPNENVHAMTGSSIAFSVLLEKCEAKPTKANNTQSKLNPKNQQVSEAKVDHNIVYSEYIVSYTKAYGR